MPPTDESPNPLEETALEETEEAAARSWPAAIAEELRERPMAYAVLAMFVLAGPIVTHMLFPEAPRGVGLFGGVAFGAYAALCAMPGRFL